ncbi:MAG: type II toxin-antitoxin system VapC family toxin [Chloroflexota bacterium]
MTGYLVDTDWIVDCLHGQQAALQTIADLAPQGLAISLITYGELYEGAYYARDPRQAMASLRKFLRRVRRLTLTVAVMERFGVVRGGLPRVVRDQIGDMDLLIAATALHHDLTLVTRNLRDFSRVPGLKLYQPS